MTEPGLLQPPGGAALHRSTPARVALAVGLCALGIGDLAVIHRVLLPRYLAEARGTPARAVSPRAAPVAETPVTAAGVVTPPVAEPVVAPGMVTPPAAEPSAAGVAALPPPPAVVGGTVESPRPPAPAAPPVAVLSVAPTVAPAEPVPASAEPAREPAGLAPAERPPAVATAGSSPGDFSDLLFSINTTALSRASRETLDQVVAALEADPARRVILSGHTDAAGPPELNRALARARARRASRYLQAHGIESARVEIQSFGAERPAEDAIPGPMRARNRRVEIVIE